MYFFEYLTLRGSRSSSSLFLDAVLLEHAHEGKLVSGGLEATVAKFGRRIDELEVDFFQSRSLRMDEQRLKNKIKY